MDFLIEYFIFGEIEMKHQVKYFATFEAAYSYAQTIANLERLLTIKEL